MTEYKLEEVMIMKPMQTAAKGSIGFIAGPIAVGVGIYFGYKLWTMIQGMLTERFSAEEKPVSNLTANAGVVEVKEYSSNLEGQAYGQTANNYLQTYPVAKFGQNFGGRAF